MGRISRYKEPVSMTAKRWISLVCQRNISGEGIMVAGNTKRIGGMSLVREESSTIKPAWSTRSRIVPVRSEWNTDEYMACSVGGSDSLGGFGRGVLRREVWIGIEVTCGDENSTES
jgi:hypothetical protein